MSRRLASPVKPSWLPCDRTRLHPLSRVRPGSSGIGPWWTAGRRTRWRYIPPPMWECCCGQTPHCSPPMKRFFHRLPHPDLRLERVCCQPRDLLPLRQFQATTVATKIAAPLGRGLMKPYLLTRRPDQWPLPCQRLNHLLRRCQGRHSYWRRQPNLHPNRHYPWWCNSCQASSPRWRTFATNWQGRYLQWLRKPWQTKHTKFLR